MNEQTDGRTDITQSIIGPTYVGGSKKDFLHCACSFSSFDAKHINHLTDLQNYNTTKVGGG